MSENLIIEKTKDQIIETVLENIVRMLTNRGVLNKSDLKDNIAKYKSQKSDNMVHKIILNDSTDEKYVMVKMIQGSIKAINKSSGISDFLADNAKYPCIIVAGDSTKKAKHDLRYRYPKAELFHESDLMIDLVSLDCQPKFRLLTEKEKTEFYEEYNCKTKQYPSRMLLADPVSRYFNAKRGDIFLIIRPSVASGLSNSYRVVV